MSNKEMVNPTTPMHFVAQSRTSLLNRELKTDDGNGKRNENVISLDWQKNNFARVRIFFLVHFLAVIARLRRESAYNFTFSEDMNS